MIVIVDTKDRRSLVFKWADNFFPHKALFAGFYYKGSKHLYMINFENEKRPFYITQYIDGKWKKTKSSNIDPVAIRIIV